MRINVEKYLFLGLEKNRANFFQLAQQQGIIQFIEANKGPQIVSLTASKIHQAIGILRHHAAEHMVLKIETDIVDGSDPFDVAKKTLDFFQQYETLLQEKRLVQQEVARVIPFGHFKLDDIDYIESKADYKIRFFSGKSDNSSSHAGLLESEKELIYVGSMYGMDYFVAICSPSEHHKQFPMLVEMLLDQSLEDLKDRLTLISEELVFIQQELSLLTAYLPALEEYWVEQLNQHNLMTVQNYVEHQLEGKVFAIEGWVPHNKKLELQQLVEDTDIYCSQVAIEQQDFIPTHLENSGAARIGEDLVQIYDTPSINDKDPSTWVLCAFTLFFAMIIGDAGYGLIFLGLALYLQYQNKQNWSKVTKRMVNLFTLLSGACVIWGVLTTSFFGMNIDINNPLREFSLIRVIAKQKAAYHIDNKDSVYQELISAYPNLSQEPDAQHFLNYAAIAEDGISFPVYEQFANNIMFELSLFIGVVHIISSFARSIRNNTKGFGWILFLIGSYLYFPEYLNTNTFINYILRVDHQTCAIVGLKLVYIGIAWPFTLSLIQGGIAGLLLEFMNLVQVFSDVMSYLRLYALGLSGGMLSGTFNQMSAKTPIVISILILLLGHTINMILGIMGGVVHGLRLNFLEWYHYTFEGGGKRFNPLRLLKLRD
ncbi:MAG: ntpI [Chlamydiales bacterium]|jgi:V/A-type H+-transporting ATPase subunit I|nr:ntpI [Chlamydiales bacterium]